MTRFSRTAFAAAALTVMLVSPAAAAMKPGSWWVAGDGWLAELVNVNLDVALRNDLSITSGGDIVGIDYGAEFSGRFRGGWQSKDPTDNSYMLSYWSYDQDESMSVSGGILPMISDPLFGNSNSQSADSTANVKVSVLDLMLSRRLAGTRKSTWTWAVGLRRASFEEDWTTRYFDPLIVRSGARETVRINVDSSGTGMTAGLGGSFDWGRGFRTTARAQVSLLMGDTDFSINDRGFNDLFAAFQTTGIERSGQDRLFQQLELEARVVYRAWRTLDVSLGYGFLNMGQMSQVDRFLDDVQGAPATLNEDASFHGFVLGVSYLFE